MNSAGVEQVVDVLDNRAGVILRGEWGHVSALRGGGHICQLVTQSRPDMNPLWRPPWHTRDPERYHADADAEQFGGPPDGRLLAGIAGHSLSFDHFGPPSQEETAAGLSTHGEAPAIQWQIFRELRGSYPGVEYGAELPVAEIDFRRTLRIDPKDPVVYCEEAARNLSRADRPICWNEHVTVGPPFLECGATRVDMPATHARVISGTYSDAILLQPDADFVWPQAPLEGGGAHDLRTTPDGRYSRYTAQLLDRTRDLGFVAISNPKAGLLLAYVFRRADFPWVGNWEERFCRNAPPWNGKTFCRGVEFSTTPFAKPRRETISEGPLFHESTYRWLPAASEIKVRYVILVMAIPPDFEGVSEVSLEHGHFVLHESGKKRIFSVPADASLLMGRGAGRE
jgi:hypothetical protein